MNNRDLRPLGRSGIQVSPLAMGCWAIAGDAVWGTQDEKAAIAAMRRALDCNVNFFDTAETYGDGYSEELLGRALHDVRDHVVIGTKVTPTHADTWENLEHACTASLRRLQTDVIDVYHLHWPNRRVPIAETLGMFARLRDAGKIRSFAVSNFGKGDLTELQQHGRCEANQLPYSLLWRVIEAEIVPLCRASDIGITCYSPLTAGLLTGKFKTAEDVPDGRARTRHFAGTRALAKHDEPGCEAETFAAIAEIAAVAAELGRPMAEVALAWLMHQPGVTSVLVGVRSPEQMTENAKAMDLILSPDVLARLDQATAGLKRHFGLNPDPWQTESRYR